MNIKVFYIFLLGVIIAPSILAGVGSGQSDIGWGWTVTPERPFAYIAGELKGTVNGPEGALYQLHLVNTTTWASQTIHHGNTNTSYGNDTFSVELNPEIYEAGH